MMLRDLFLTLSTLERTALAKKAELNPTYLWQIARRWNGKRPSIDAINRLVAADSRLTATDLMREFALAPQAMRQGQTECQS